MQCLTNLLVQKWLKECCEENWWANKVLQIRFPEHWESELFGLFLCLFQAVAKLLCTWMLHFSSLLSCIGKSPFMSLWFMGRQFTYVSKRTNCPPGLVTPPSSTEQRAPAAFSGCWTSSLVQLQRINAAVGSAHWFILLLMSTWKASSETLPGSASPKTIYGGSSCTYLFCC